MPEKKLRMRRKGILAGIALLLWLFVFGMPLTSMAAPSRSPLDPFVNTVLPNGLTLYVKEIHTTPIVAVDFWVNTGAINDPTDQLGISHFLEHMMFKGTPRRSAFEIAKAIEDSGGYMNAATSLNTTHYYMTLPSEDWNLALEVMTDALLNSSFAEAEIAKERQVILEEIRLKEDNPYRKLAFLANQAVFAGTPYANDILGTAESLARIGPAQMRAYQRKYYVPNNMVLAVSGDVSAKQVMAKVRELFQDVVRQPIYSPARINLPELSTVKRVAAEKAIDQTYLYWGFPIASVPDRDYNAWLILAKILGEGNASRLNQELREKQQLVNFIVSDFAVYAGVGVLAVYGQSQDVQVPEVEKAICAELSRIAAKGVTQAEIDRAKALIRCNNIYAVESASDIAAIFGQSALNNDLDGFIHALYDLKTVSRRDVQRLAQKIRLDAYVSAVVKPQEVK